MDDTAVDELMRRMNQTRERVNAIADKIDGHVKNRRYFKPSEYRRIAGDLSAEIRECLSTMNSLTFEQTKGDSDFDSL